MIPSIIKDQCTAYLKEHHAPQCEVRQSHLLGGGDINTAYRLETTTGDFFVKYNFSSLYPGMFETESQGLMKLTGTGELRVPQPIWVGHAGKYSFLLMEYIWQGGFKPDFWMDFGRKLARIHRHTSRMFGLPYDNYIGSLRQSNQAHETWASFFIEERIEKQLQFGMEHGTLPRSLSRSFQNLYRRLPDLIPDEPPALIHGDLWSGNFITDPEGNAVLIDPAVYYGHREADLAMTRLFGGFSASFYDAYNEEFKLEGGWRERIEIHNLYPLLVHANLFGGGYLQSVETILKRF